MPIKSSWRTRTKGAVYLHWKIHALATSSTAPNTASLAATGYARYVFEYFMTILWIKPWLCNVDICVIYGLTTN